MNHNLTLIPFELNGKVYRAPLPFGDFDIARTTFNEMVQAEISVLYSLIEPIEWLSRAYLDPREKIEQAGIQRVEFPIRDFFAPIDPQAFQAVVAQARQDAVEGKNIAVHCYAGVGRTGLFLAEFAIQLFGMEVHAAVDWLRETLPLAVENDYQYRFLLELHSQH